jgi:hypothetical protein
MKRWVVSKFTNAITEREPQKDDFHFYEEVASREDGVKFVLERAQRSIENARADLKRRENQFKALKKKFGATT